MMLFCHVPQMALWFNEGHSQSSSENDLQKKIHAFMDVAQVLQLSHLAKCCLQIIHRLRNTYT